MREWALPPILAVLGGCGHSEQEVAGRPAEWTATYNVPWKDMASCIGLGMTGEYRVTPDMFPAEQRARLKVEFYSGMNAGLYSIYDVAS